MVGGSAKHEDERADAQMRSKAEDRGSEAQRVRCSDA